MHFYKVPNKDAVKNRVCFVHMFMFTIFVMSKFTVKYLYYVHRHVSSIYKICRYLFSAIFTAITMYE